MSLSRWTCAIAASLAVLLFVGCGGEESTDGSGNEEANASEANSEPAGPTDAELLADVTIPAEKAQSPTAVVRTFLAAVRDGEGSVIDGEHFLTHKAILANRRENTPFQPPANPTAAFSVVGEDLLPKGSPNPTAAHVLTEWKDEGDPEFGIPPSESDIIWVLRKEDGVGWGISGALFQPFPDMDGAVALDFEDPEDFQKTIAWVEEEGKRRMQVAERTNGPPIDRGQLNGQGGGNGQAPLNNGQAPLNNGQAPLNNGQVPINNGQPPLQGGNN